MTTKQLTHDALKLVKLAYESSVIIKEAGICGNFERGYKSLLAKKARQDGYTLDIAEVLDEVCRAKFAVLDYSMEWHLHSGDRMCPVPVPEQDKIRWPNMAPYSWYMYRAKQLTLWAGDYGKLRLELLDFLIERTKP